MHDLFGIRGPLLFLQFLHGLIPVHIRAETIDQTFPMKVEGNTITIEHTKGHSVTVYDDYGRQVEHRDDCPATFRYRTKTPGNYLVRIDNGETRRVVIAD